MYIKNATMFIPDNDPDLKPVQTMGDEAEDDRLDRLYTTAACLIPCKCCCEVAITKPTPRICYNGDDEVRGVVFRALCPECHASADFVMDASFFGDHTA